MCEMFRCICVMHAVRVMFSICVLCSTYAMSSTYMLDHIMATWTGTLRYSCSAGGGINFEILKNNQGLRP